TTSIDSMLDVNRHRCHELLVKAAKVLGIHFVKYYFPDHAVRFYSVVPKYQQVAFLLFSNDAVDRDNVRALTSLVPEKDPDSLLRSTVEGIFVEYGDPYLKKPWSGVKEAPKGVVDSYLKHFILTRSEE